MELVIDGVTYPVDESKKSLIDGEVECFPLGGQRWAFKVPSQRWQTCCGRPDEPQGPEVPSAIAIVSEFGAKNEDLPWSVWYRKKLSQRKSNNSNRVV